MQGSTKNPDNYAIAHIGSDHQEHRLEDHLHEVSRLAGNSPAFFDSGDWARLAGLWTE